MYCQNLVRNRPVTPSMVKNEVLINTPLGKYSKVHSGVLNNTHGVVHNTLGGVNTN